MSTFNEMIKEAREKAGISQSELARRMEVHQSSVVRLEKGSHAITETTLRKVAEALGLELVVKFTKPKAA
jgi:ribosome-binding protein aMBF1 (putative translation factor)